MTDFPSSPGSVRVGDRERTEAAERLSAHAAAGRLGIDELEERLEKANVAVFARDLVALEADLPGPRTARPRVWRPFPLVPVVALLAAAVALSVAVGHPVAPLFFFAALLWWRGGGFAIARRLR